MLKLAFLSLLLLLTNPSWGKSLTLKEAVLYGIDHSPSLDSSRRQLAISQMDRRSAIARLLPSLDLSSRNGVQGQSPGSFDTPWASQLSLGLTENLYDNGQSWTQLRISQLTEELSSHQYHRDRDRLSLDIATV